jgi:hypothetical protein
VKTTSRMMRARPCRVAVRQIAFAMGLAFAACPAAHGAEADCKAVADAMIANTKTPYHSYTTITIEYAAPLEEARRKMGMPTSQESEAISTGSDLFVKLPTGKWIDTRTPADRVLEQVREATSKFGKCERLADETVEGRLHQIYVAHSDDAEHRVTTKIWISADRGLPGRTETDISVMETPDEAVARQHIVTRSDYGDVRAPEVK